MTATMDLPVQTNSIDLGSLFDPLEPGQLEDPYPVYALARRREPVFYSPRYDVWVVTRHADLCALLRDTAGFSSAGALEAQRQHAPEVQAVLSEGYLEFQSLVQSDPPDHTRIRNVFGKAFSPQRIAAMEPQIRAIADDLIDGFAREGRADLAGRFAFPLPGMVICDLLGVPRADIGQIKRWSNDKQILLSASVPLPQLVESAHGYVALQRYFLAALRERVERPREDLLTILAPTEIGGTAPLTLQEAVCNAMDLLAAGHETTTDLIGNGLALLMAHPEQLAALRDDPGLIPNAIEEMLRMEAPVRGLFRSATTDVSLGGAVIPRGARVFALYASGSRDEAQFPEPDRFDVRRKDASAHLAFSKGIHYCVGNVLARLEGRIAFERLLPRLPNLRPLPGAVRRPYLILRGYERLPVAWDVPAGDA